MTLSAYIEGIGLLGPGLNGWPDSVAVLAGQLPYQPQKTVLPPPALLPPAERRRGGAIIKLTLAVGSEAIAAAAQDAAHLPSVFASSGGDGDTCHAICEVLASDDRRISPSRFHNSVHNAAAGYWSIATGAMTPASVLSAYDGSFCAGLLEALSQVTVDHTRSVLLACDTHYPEPLNRARPIRDALGIALVLAPQRGGKSLAKISARLTGDAADRLDNAALEDLRHAIPAARGLPLMRAIARRECGTIVLEYLDNLRVAVDIEPC
jgi:Beta-ketoacyl synthase, N-terminal domain